MRKYWDCSARKIVKEEELFTEYQTADVPMAFDNYLEGQLAINNGVLEEIKDYAFSYASLATMYDAVCASSCEISHNAISKAKTGDDMLEVMHDADITVKFGHSTITLPANADFIEILFGALNQCLKEA